MATLAQWNMEQEAASTVAAGISASNLANTQSLPIWGQNTSRGFASDPIAFAAPLSGAISAATALSLGSWFPVTITPDAGATVSLSAVSFVIAKDGSSGTRGYVLRSSADNYASDLAAAVVATVKPTWTTVSVDLSGIAALQDCADPITFRIYLYTSGALQQMDFDDITIEGTVVGGSGAVLPMFGGYNLGKSLLRGANL